MAHSHLLVQHLLKQLEQHAANRTERDPRPSWLIRLIDQAAECFLPLTGVARVGYESELIDDGWEVRMYLGKTEVVGGRDDGQARSTSFELDLAALTSCFSRVDEFRWNVAGGETGGSFLTVRGAVGEETVCVKTYSRAPHHAGPALREYADGRIQPVDGVRLPPWSTTCATAVLNLRDRIPACCEPR